MVGQLRHFHLDNEYLHDICRAGTASGTSDAVEVVAGRAPAEGGGNDGIPGDRNRVHRPGGRRRGADAGRARVGGSRRSDGWNGYLRGKGVRR